MNNRKVIYLADDDADDRFLIIEAIKSLSHHIAIFECENGEELLARVKTNGGPEIALILLDMNMPILNGLETLARIKAIPELAVIPAVMLSTSTDPSLAQQASKAGIDRFIVKSDTFEGILDCARQLIEGFLT